MSKTFKSIEGRFSIGIRPVKDGVQFRIIGTGGSYLQFTTSANDAAEQALAILEAAGVAESSDAGVAAHYLRAHLTEQERATAEAEAQAKLEAEAFNLYRAYMDIHEPMNAIGDWHMLAEHTKEKWLAVARKAREIRAEK